MSKFFIFLLIFFLSSSCSLLKNKSTRRGDFVAGCFIGVQSSSPVQLTEQHLNRIIDYCLYTYDSKKEKIDKILDSTNKDIEKVPPQTNLNFDNSDSSSEEEETVIFI